MNGGTPTHPHVGDEAELGIDGLSQVSIVGSGGSSTVYRARQDALDRTVAVKVVHAAWSIETRERFEHEQEVMGRLSGHTATVPIFETGVTNRGEPYLLLPFYRRGSLFRLMRERGPLPWPEAAFIVEALAGALADCHREGIVHRDVKPGNVLLTDHLQPRLADFGITLPTDEPTSMGTVAYTPFYSPPEALEPGNASPTTDVYGLGATLWALLAGTTPNTSTGSSTERAETVGRSPTGPAGPPRPETPLPLVALLERTMAGDPDRRPPDGAAFAAELRQAVRLSEAGEDDPAPAVPSGPARSTGGAATPHDRLVTALLASLVVVGMALVVAGWTLWR